MAAGRRKTTTQKTQLEEQGIVMVQPMQMVQTPMEQHQMLLLRQESLYQLVLVSLGYLD